MGIPQRLGDIYEAQICTHFVRSAEIKEKANIKKYHSGFGGCETRVR